MWWLLVRAEDQALGERLALARATRLAAHKASGGVAHTISTHSGRKSSTQSRAKTTFWAAQARYPAWDFLARGVKRPLPLVGESAESRVAHADDSGPPKPTCVLVTLRSYRTGNDGYKICREWSVRTTSAATRVRVNCRTSASAVCSLTGWRAALCSRSTTPIVLQKGKTPTELSRSASLPIACCGDVFLQFLHV